MVVFFHSSLISVSVIDIDELILTLNIAELSLDFKQESIYQSICFSANLTILLWWCAADKVWITELTLIHKILDQFVTRMHMFISQSDVKHIMTSLIKTIMSVLKASTDIITTSDNVCLDFQISIILYLCGIQLYCSGTEVIISK